jgi:hypothetical protein
MGGNNSGSSSQHNSNNSTASSSGGRERAIEALIDREPQGDYYRAARVIVRFCVRRICDNIFLNIRTLTSVFRYLLSCIVGRGCSHCSCKSSKFDNQIGINRTSLCTIPI